MELSGLQRLFLTEFNQISTKLGQNLCPLYRECPLYGVSVSERFHCISKKTLNCQHSILLNENKETTFTRIFWEELNSIISDNHMEISVLRTSKMRGFNLLLLCVSKFNEKYTTFPIFVLKAVQNEDSTFTQLYAHQALVKYLKQKHLNLFKVNDTNQNEI